MVRIQFLALLLLVSISARAQWQQLPGPGGAWVYDFAEIHVGSIDRVLLATDNGIWRSEDSLQTWSPAGLEGYSVQRLFVYSLDLTHRAIFATAQTYLDTASNYLLAPQTLFCSLDNGTHWSAVNKLRSSVIGLAKDQGQLIVATNDDVYFSTDFGKTFDSIAYPTIGSNIPPNILRVELSGDNLIAIGWFLLNDSISYGAKYSLVDDRWSAIDNIPIGTTDLWTSGDTLYAGAGKPYLISLDHGDTWKVDSFKTGPTKSICGKWISCSSGGPPHYYTYSTVHDEYIWQVATSGTNLFVVSNNILYGSTDHGMTWELQDSSSSYAPSYGNGFFQIGDTLFAAMASLLKWNGNRWVKVVDTIIQSLAGDGHIIYAGLGYNGTQWQGTGVRSTDNGATWSFIPVPPAVEESDIAYLLCDGARVYALVEGWSGELHLNVSTDSGLTWSPTNTPSGWYNPTAFIKHEGALYIADEYGLWRSDDSAKTWTKNLMIDNATFLHSVKGALVFDEADPRLNNKQYLGRVQYLFDNGTIRTVASDDSLSLVRTFGVDNTYAYLGTTSRGLWRAKLSDVGLGVLDHSSVSSKGLSIYPNPSTDKIVFSFDLAERSHITLKLYDARGTLCATIFDGEHEAGDVSIPFYDPHLANGIYEAILTYSSGTTGSSINRVVGRLAICR